MSQRDSFPGGFFAGAIFGGLVGGVLGALLTSRRSNESDREDQSLLEPSTEENIEVARRSLEDKIAQLDLAIDDVRQRLGAVNGNTSEKE